MVEVKSDLSRITCLECSKHVNGMRKGISSKEKRYIRKVHFTEKKMTPIFIIEYCTECNSMRWEHSLCVIILCKKESPNKNTLK